MSAVYVHNITINSGTDYEQEYDMYEVGGKIVDLTNYTAKAQLRQDLNLEDISMIFFLQNQMEPMR
jgi:hypothetical protein